MSLQIATLPAQGEAEASCELDESHSVADANHSTMPGWSNSHAILVLCLVMRACGLSDEEVVEGLVTPLQFEGVCDFSLEESVLCALALIPRTKENAGVDGASEATADVIAVADDSTAAPQIDSDRGASLSQILEREMRAMDRGGIRHGHGYEF